MFQSFAMAFKCVTDHYKVWGFVLKICICTRGLNLRHKLNVKLLTTKSAIEYTE